VSYRLPARLDLTIRRTVLQFTPSPNRLTAGRAEFTVALAPKETASFQLVVGFESGPEERPLVAFDQARVEAKADLGRHKAQLCRIESVNGQFNALVQRAASDLHMMITTLPSGPYPYAGVPWFNAPFGRDGIITALECLWFHPSLARGVLAYLASTQATEVIPSQDAEPGKILHETRNGEMATLGEMPFGRYYGTVDATPLTQPI
jgi:glycogen debranching enzyme